MMGRPLYMQNKLQMVSLISEGHFPGFGSFPFNFSYMTTRFSAALCYCA